MIQPDETLTIFLVGEDVVVNRRRLSGISPATKKFTLILKQRGIESLAFLHGLQIDEFRQFLRDLSSPDLSSIVSRNCIRLGKVELMKNSSDGLSEVSGSNDPAATENQSGQLNQQPVFLTGQEPHELEEQYSMIHREKKIETRKLDQIVARVIKEMARNL
jgi:hypothetical protein